MVTTRRSWAGVAGGGADDEDPAGVPHE